MNTELLIKQPAPHVRRSISVATMMMDVIIALLPLYIMAFYYYGIRAVNLGICSALVTEGLSMICSYLEKRKVYSSDLSPIITGLIIPLLMPANIPFYVVITAAAVAIVAVKFPFGGTAENMFNPAAVGFAAVALCWPELVFTYPQIGDLLSTGISPAYSLSIGVVPDAEINEMLIGNIPGPMGASNILVILACGVFLIVRKDINWRIPLYSILTYCFLSLISPRTAASPIESMLYEILSGVIVFGSVFMLTEPVTSPKNNYSVTAYSVISAISAFLFRRFGGFEDGFIFALILMNVFSPLFDDVCELFLHLLRNGKLNKENLRSEINLLIHSFLRRELF